MASTQLDVETGRGKAGEEHKSGIGHLGEEHFGEGEVGPEMIQHARLERG